MHTSVCRHLGVVTVAAVAVASGLLGAVPGAVRHAAADTPTITGSPLRSGWDGKEPFLTPSQVGGGGFHELFAPLVDGVVYAQPVAAGGVIVVATENDTVHGFDESSGAELWRQTAGTPEPYPTTPHDSGTPNGCDQIVPNYGVTSTPVVDRDTGTVYVMARDYSAAAPATATAYRLHAYDLHSGAERPGWPVTIAGVAWNRPDLAFDAYRHLQRPALLLLDGTVFAGFGSFCDVQPYYGWIAGVSTSTSRVGLYVDVPYDVAGAFWASGGGFVNDRPHSFLATSSNAGTSTTGQPPIGMDGRSVMASTNLGDSVVRFAVRADGVTVTPVDFFAPERADVDDLDLGSSAVAALPDSFGDCNHPHLALVGDKFGAVFLLDRDNLGGRQAGDAGALGRLDGTDPLYGTFGAWPGDGGWVYMDGLSHLDAFRVDPSGITGPVAQVPIGYGAGSPLITSDGLRSGSAVLWMYDRVNSEVRAFAAVPRGGTLQELFNARVGSGSLYAKFNEVAADQGRIMVAADDMRLHVFGVGGLPPAGTAAPFAGNDAGADCSRQHDPNAPQGYWELGADGGIFPWGNAPGLGSTGASHLNQPIVGMAGTSHGAGYYLVARDGGLFPFGDAATESYGSLGGTPLNRPIVGMAANPHGGGYWMVASDGGVFPFGPAACGCGSLGAVHLNAPIVAMAATPSGDGYWLVAADGGLFPFGDAAGHSHGSLGGTHLNQPIVGIAATVTGDGYFMVASDGGLFPFGDATGHSHGSTGGMHLNKPIVGMAVSEQGDGYWLVAADGGIFPFGDAAGYGSTGDIRLSAPMVGIAAT